MNSNVDFMEDLATIHEFADQIRRVQSGAAVVPYTAMPVTPYRPPVQPTPQVIYPRPMNYGFPPSPAERYRWWIIGAVSACAMGIVALVIWLVMALVHTLTVVATGVATGVAGVLPLLVLGVLALLLCSRGRGSGKTFSGTFTGRVH